MSDVAVCLSFRRRQACRSGEAMFLLLHCNEHWRSSRLYTLATFRRFAGCEVDRAQGHIHAIHDDKDIHATSSSIVRLHAPRRNAVQS